MIPKLYQAKTEPSLITVPRLKFLAIDGQGAPAISKEFQPAIQALYGTAYMLKFGLKKKMPEYPRPQGYADYKVGALEGLWWSVGGKFDVKKPKNWRWTLLMPMPGWMTAGLVNKAKKQLQDKKRLAAAAKLKLINYAEGRAVQILHIGPYSKEEPSINKMYEFAQAKDLKFKGKHHEIYLGDPRRAAPSRLKTILRHAVTHK